jgi:3-hydroxyisobutyrate dehydrogenase-like beta-hydroxyacid dehydrogenase
MNVVVIGLGNMGGPIAANIARARYQLTVYDVDAAKSAPLEVLGARVASSITEAVESADVVFTSLPTPKVIESVTLGPLGLLSSMQPESTLIELSTNNLDCGRRLQDEAKNKNIHLLDAPISGGTEGAASGTLTIMVGGELETFNEHRALLDVIGGDVRHMGPHGAGYVAKIAQVVLCYLHSIALSEALMLGTKGGIKPEAMLDLIQNSTGRSYVADRYGPTLLDGSYDPGFALGLAHKDMALTLELAESVGAVLPLCKQVEDTYKRAVDSFGFDQNHLMAIKLLEDENNTLLRTSSDA